MKKILAVLAIVASNCFAQTGPSHWPVRLTVAAGQVGTVGQHQVMMLGDSITEMFWWNQLSNHFVLNVGLGGAGIDEAIAAATAILPAAQPKVVVLMIGINDCMIGNATNSTAWGVKYVGLLNQIHAAGAVPVALNVLPVENSTTLPLGTNYFDTACINRLNSEWWNAVTSRGEVYVNLNYVFAVAPAYQYMQPGWTMDGVHPYGIGMSTLYYQINPAVAIAWARTP